MDYDRMTVLLSDADVLASASLGREAGGRPNPGTRPDRRLHENHKRPAPSKPARPNPPRGAPPVKRR